MIKKLRVAERLMIISTWANGWDTSSRYHEPVIFPCLFGCMNKKDELSHYVTCSHLYALARFFRPDAHNDPIVRLGLVGPSEERMMHMACVFCGYHAMHRDTHARPQFCLTNL